MHSAMQTTQTLAGARHAQVSSELSICTSDVVTATHFPIVNY